MNDLYRSCVFNKPKILRYFLGLLGVVFAMTASVTGEAERAPGIAMWERAPANYGAGLEISQPSKKNIDFSALTMKTRTLFDIQYQEKRIYRGVYLRDVIRQHRRSEHVNLVLLHFSNGMIVPWMLRPTPELGPKVFLAFETAPKKDGPFTAAFEPVSNKAEVTMDPRPIKMSGNKIVVSETTYPWLKNTAGDSFTPFMHVDSLVGIEWVHQEAYYKQFWPGFMEGQESHQQSSVLANERQLHKEGFQVYFQNCQYCHSYYGAGAQYGWDFVQPVPLHRHKSTKQLLHHVSYPPYNALGRGLMMPTLPHFTKEELNVFMEYSKAISESEQLWPYAPKEGSATLP